jgi:hypothetical protein
MVGRRSLAALAIAVATVLALGTGTPAGAATGSYYLPIGVMSPQFKEVGCRYKVHYFNYGPTPVAVIRLYDAACGTPTIWVKSADGNGEHWTPSNVVALTASDGCGTYRYIQATGPSPGYALGMTLWTAWDPDVAWEAYNYEYDNTAQQPIHATC